MTKSQLCAMLKSAGVKEVMIELDSSTPFIELRGIDDNGNDFSEQITNADFEHFGL